MSFAESGLFNKSYLNNFTEEYFKAKGTTKESVSAELAKLVEAINFTQNEAVAQEKNNIFKRPSFMPYYDVENCAEVLSVRQAIMEGAKFDEIQIICISKKSGEVVSPCENCEKTFKSNIQLKKEDLQYVE